MLVIPKPGREIPKSVEKRSENDCQLGVKLARSWWFMRDLLDLAWAVRWRQRNVGMTRPDQSGKMPALSLQGPSRTGVGCLRYEGGNNHA